MPVLLLLQKTDRSEGFIQQQRLQRYYGTRIGLLSFLPGRAGGLENIMKICSCPFVGPVRMLQGIFTADPVRFEHLLKLDDMLKPVSISS
jgi:hypothetical protein